MAEPPSLLAPPGHRPCRCWPWDWSWRGSPTRSSPAHPSRLGAVGGRARPPGGDRAVWGPGAAALLLRGSRPEPAHRRRAPSDRAPLAGTDSRGTAGPGLTAVPGLAWQADHPKGHYRDALAHVAAHALPGDLILLGNPHQWVPFTYYNLTGLPHESVAAGRPLPDEAVASADRIWVLEWETWATDDMAAIWEELLGQATIAYRLDLLRRAPEPALPHARLAATDPARPNWDEARRWPPSTVYPATGQAVLASLCWSGRHPPTPPRPWCCACQTPQGRTWAQTVQPGAVAPAKRWRYLYPPRPVPVRGHSPANTPST